VDHLTPDVLAAWMDGTLTATERTAAEAHASDCAHCQAMLAAMARTAPAPARQRWWTIGSVRWLVPIAAAMVAIFVWVGVNPTSLKLRETGHEPSPAKTKVAETASAPLPPVEPEHKAPAPAESRAKAPSQLAKSATLRDEKADSAKLERAPERRQSARALEAPASVTALDKIAADRRDALGSNLAAGQAAAPAAPAPAPVAPLPVGGLAQSAPVPSVPAPTAPPAEPPQVKPQALQETVTVTGETPAPVARAAGRGGMRMPPVEIMSPERSYRWRAVTPGSVQYTVDDGLSWRSSTTGTTVALHAGAAPSRQVCWLVGQAGTVLLTTDGQNWQVRPFPERADLTDVSATDARNATVTTTDRRRFATTDGGATWSPLQEN